MAGWWLWVAWAWADWTCSYPQPVGLAPFDGETVPPDATFAVAFQASPVPPCEDPTLELRDGAGRVVPADVVTEGDVVSRLVPHALLPPGPYHFRWDRPGGYGPTSGEAWVTVEPHLAPEEVHATSDLVVSHTCEDRLTTYLETTTVFDRPFGGLMVFEYSASGREDFEAVVVDQAASVVERWAVDGGSEFCGTVRVYDVTGAVVHEASGCESYACATPSPPVEVAVAFDADCPTARTRVTGTLTLVEVAPGAVGTLLMLVNTETGPRGPLLDWFVDQPQTLTFGLDVPGTEATCVRFEMHDLAGGTAWSTTETCGEPAVCAPLREVATCGTVAGAGAGPAGVWAWWLVVARRRRGGEARRQSDGKPSNAADNTIGRSLS